MDTCIHTHAAHVHAAYKCHMRGRNTVRTTVWRRKNSPLPSDGPRSLPRAKIIRGGYEGWLGVRCRHLKFVGIPREEEVSQAKTKLSNE